MWKIYNFLVRFGLMHKTFITLSLFFVFACNQSVEVNDSSNIIEDKNKLLNDKPLESLLPLDKVKEIWLTNWKGNHQLSENQKNELINNIKDAKFIEGRNSFKPGHLAFRFIFFDGESLEFYGSNEVLVMDGGYFYELNHCIGEFNLTRRVNFENY